MPAADLVTYGSREERVSAMNRDGFVYFPKVLNSQQVQELRACTDRIQTVEAPGFDWVGNDGPGTKSIKTAFNRHPLYLECLDKPGVIELAEDVLGDDCHIIQMNQWNTGRRENTGMHTDWKPIALPDDIAADPRVQIPAWILTAHFQLDDMDEDFGPTRVIPGSHRAGSKPQVDSKQWNGVEEQSLLCNAGDVIVFRADLWHQGGANRTDRIRYLLQVHYANRWIAQRFPPYLSFRFKPEILSLATPRQRRLLGEHVPASFA